MVPGSLQNGHQHVKVGIDEHHFFSALQGGKAHADGGAEAVHIIQPALIAAQSALLQAGSLGDVAAAVRADGHSVVNAALGKGRLGHVQHTGTLRDGDRAAEEGLFGALHPDSDGFGGVGIGRDEDDVLRKDGGGQHQCHHQQRNEFFHGFFLLIIFVRDKKRALTGAVRTYPVLSPAKKHKFRRAAGLLTQASTAKRAFRVIPWHLRLRPPLQ